MNRSSVSLEQKRVSQGLHSKWFVKADASQLRTYHFGVCPPLLSTLVFLASLPKRAAQYGFCLPIVFLLGRFFARSHTITRVPISGPSTVISAYIPAA